MRSFFVCGISAPCRSLQRPVCIFVRRRSGAETLYIRASDEHVHPVAAGMLRGLQRVGVAGFKVDAGPVAYMVDFLVLGVVLMNNQLGIADHNMI